MTQPSDPQSRAYREAGPADHWDDDVNALIEQHGAVVHDEATVIDDVRGPDSYETDGWDIDRDGPKTIGEAREALAARIADPSAPDTEAEAGAYDEES
jgi:hypothetical protein